MGSLLIGKTVKLNHNQDEETQGLEFQIVDKVNATHYNNAGDDVYVATSVKTGKIRVIQLSALEGATILPGSEQA